MIIFLPPQAFSCITVWFVCCSQRDFELGYLLIILTVFVCPGTVHDIVNRGGRCLIPVFALGRAQELLLILGGYDVSPLPTSSVH